MFVFFGTPDFAATILEKLIQNTLKPDLVICNPDKPVGRKKIITPPPTKVIAERNNIPVWQPKTLDVDSFRLEVKKFGDFDFAILAAYAKILPQEIIDSFKMGIIVVHPSLLPKYRGATPIQTALLNGETKTGTALILMDAQVDHGPVLAKSPLTIADDDNYETLSKKLADLSANLLIENLPKFISNSLTPQPQNETEATYTKKFITEDGLLDLENGPLEKTIRKIKALNPNPGTYVIKNGVRIKILDLKTIQYESKKPRRVDSAIEFINNI
ncbi:MAG: methionyl-tRNA formyltransferase [bacterium]|nr:methionyl-tRNA formyltransferase [bacterium]